MGVNGDIERAELEALKAAPLDEKLDWIVTCAYKTNKAVEAMPDVIADAIALEKRRDAKRLSAIAAGVGAVAGILTPIVLHYI